MCCTGARFCQANPDARRPCSEFIGNSSSAISATQSRLLGVQADSKTQSQRYRLNVLIVDDELDAVTMLAELLRNEGHIVHTCSNPHLVRKSIERHKPDVCILDIVMPGKTGFTVAREVLSAIKLEERPLLVAMSGVFSSASDEIIAKSAGFNHFIRKGSDPGELLRLIDGLVNHPSSPAAA